MVLAALAAACLVVAPPVGAKSKSTHKVSCQQIKDAMASGKTAEEVQKDLNVSASRVKSCTTPSTKHHKTSQKAS